MRLICLLTVHVALCFAMPVCSAEVIRIDPNTSATQPAPSLEQEDVLAKDKRLDQRVTFDAKRRRVVEILDALSAATGVAFRSGWNSKDWQVRDRKMVIYAQDVSLRDLMVSIARVMKFKWQIGGEGPDWTYRLYMDRATVLNAEFDEKKRQERMQKQLAELRQKKADNLLRVADLTDAELESSKSNDPYAYAISKLGLASMLEAIPGAKNAMASGDTLSVGYADLPLQAQETIKRNLQRLLEFKSGLDYSKPAPDNLEMLLQNSALELGNDICFYTSPASREELLRMELYDPASDAGQSMGNTMIEIMEGRPAPGIGRRVLPTLAGSAQDYEKVEWGEPRAEHPEDPSLLVKVKLQLGEKKTDGKIDFYDMLGILSRSTGYSIVSDALSGGYDQAEYLKSEDGNHEIKGMLEALVDQRYCNWWKQGSIIEIRDRCWFRKRMNQLPEEWLEKWRDKFKEKGTLDIDDLIPFTELTDEQLDMNVSDDEVLRQVTRSLDECLISFYDSLDQFQQACLYSADGLDFRDITPEQLELMSDFYQYAGGSDGIDYRLCASRERKDKHFTYKFTVKYRNEQLTDFSWAADRSLTTPEYKEPDESSDDQIAVRVSR